MAGAQPLEGDAAHSTPQSGPGAFPETPAALDDQAFSVNPIPASAEAGVHDDPELVAADAAKSKDSEQTLGISPLPATGGIGNPIQLRPGETVPESSKFTDSNHINSNVKLDKDSYEQSDAATSSIPEPGAIGAGLLGGVGLLGDKAKGLIPESSMPMGKDTPASIADEDIGPHISSVAPTSTTNQLAGQVPLEPRSRDVDPTISSVAPTSTSNDLAGAVPLESRAPPAIVSASQDQAHADPEASAVPSAVDDKKEMENELQSKVSPAPVTSESGVSGQGIVGMAAGGVATAGAMAAGTAYALKEHMFGGDKTSQAAEPTGTPAMVSDSQAKAHVGPEASAVPSAVEDKKEMESELQSKVPEALAISDSTAPPSAGQATSLADAGVPATSSTGPAWTGDAPPVTSATEAPKDVAAGAIPTTTSTNTPSLAGPASAPKTESSTSQNGLVAGITGGAAVAGAAVAGTAFALRDKTTSATGKDPIRALPISVQNSINEMDKKVEAAKPVANEGSTAATIGAAKPASAAVGTGSSDPARATTTSVPEEVVASQKAAHVDPEASASPVAVGEKSAMEHELLSKVPTADGTGTPAPTSTGALSPIVPLSTSKGAPQLADPTAGVEPLAMDTELNAPATAPTVLPKVTSTERPDASRDVSPMTVPTTSGQTQPIITTGVSSDATPTKSVGTPGRRSSFMDKLRGTPESTKTTETGATPGTSSTTDKKEKRKSFFGRLKEKIQKSDH